MIGITCGFCGKSTEFNQATVNQPPDQFCCGHCGRVVRRVHGRPKVLASGFILPGEITIKEVQPRTTLKPRVDGLPMEA